MLHTGIGETQVNNLLTSMNVPPIHHNTLKRREREAGKGIETVANRLMAKALLEEITKTRGRLVLVRHEPLRNFNGSVLL